MMKSTSTKNQGKLHSCIVRIYRQPTMRVLPACFVEFGVAGEPYVWAGHFLTEFANAPLAARTYKCLEAIMIMSQSSTATLGSLKYKEYHIL